METVWINSKLKTQKQISVWEKIARVIPSIYAITSLAYFFIGHNTVNEIVALSIFSLFSVLAVCWWWWAMDTIKYVLELYTSSNITHTEILTELKSVRETITKTHIKDNASNRQRGK